MKAHLSRTAKLALAISVGFFCGAGWTYAAQNKARPATGTPATNAVRLVAQAEIPQSVFTPTQGRNPFFPHSTQPVPVSNRTSKDPKPPVAPSDIILNGITHGLKPTAMINSRTFEVGESGEIKLPNGNRVLIKCDDIRSDSVIITVDGQQRELKLRFGV